MDYFLLAGLIASWILLVFLLLVLLQVIQQNGRVLMRLEAMERWFAQPVGDPYEPEEYVATLPVGVSAPEISLPDLGGTTRSLSEWRGQRMLLVFFDPECAFSLKLLPYLAALSSDPVPGRPTPLVVSTGDPETNRARFDDAGFAHTVLLQSGMEVASAYKVDGTPMSYLIEADGTIGSDLGAGVQATLLLAGEAEEAGGAVLDASSGPVRLRDGIKDGSTAPVFRLPLLDGGEVSLLEYRGRDVVIVFSDPDCEPCVKMMPRLQQAHEAHPGLALLVISRGGTEANRELVRQHGLTFPVALQRHWEVSREYGIVAAPVAFFVDEWGVTIGNAVIGAEAIVSLVDLVHEKSGTAT